MNIYQRIVLVCGAIALIVAIWTTPRLMILEGVTVNADTFMAALKGIDKVSPPFPDLRVMAARIAAVLGVTILLFFALKGTKK